MIDLNIQLVKNSSKWKAAFPGLRRKVEQAAAAAFLNAKKPVAFNRRSFEITLVLSDDKTIKQLNHDFRGKNKATNVLSFPQLNMQKFRRTVLDTFPPKAPVPLGDVVLAFETIRTESLTQKKDIEDHVIHLVVHGVLHLLGYDHMRVKDAKIMENLECDILEALGYPDPYHEHTQKPAPKTAVRKKR